jgi:succinate dehydrogenase flavin-adding protein (antitoxin of CptAB toxin-antitoxin module)
MKKTIIFLLIILTFACSNKPQDLVVKTNIKGLKKGTVYLKRVIDTVLVTVDSVIVNGNPEFELYAELDEPDLFILDLDKNSKEEDRISFFADKGTMEINTTLKHFVADAVIKGSEQQKILEDYQKLMSRLNNRNLDFIKERFEAERNGDTATANTIEKKQNSLFKNRYLQTVNFALNHNDSEVAPYLALSEIYNANTNLLDTIHASLTPRIKNSKYGKELQKFLEERKLDEKSN